MKSQFLPSRRNLRHTSYSYSSGDINEKSSNQHDEYYEQKNV